MKRDEFIKFCTLFGVGVPIGVSPSSCNKSKVYPNKVIVIGAGIAGMSAAYFLQQKGIPYEVLEATNTYGGRV